MIEEPSSLTGATPVKPSHPVSILMSALRGLWTKHTDELDGPEGPSHNNTEPKTQKRQQVLNVFNNSILYIASFFSVFGFLFPFGLFFGIYRFSKAHILIPQSWHGFLERLENIVRQIYLIIGLGVGSILSFVFFPFIYGLNIKRLKDSTVIHIPIQQKKGASDPEEEEEADPNAYQSIPIKLWHLGFGLPLDRYLKSVSSAPEAPARKKKILLFLWSHLGFGKKWRDYFSAGIVATLLIYAGTFVGGVFAIPYWLFTSLGGLFGLSTWMFSLGSLVVIFDALGVFDPLAKHLRQNMHTLSPIEKEILAEDGCLESDTAHFYPIAREINKMRWDLFSYAATDSVAEHMSKLERKRSLFVDTPRGL